ncbi:hypothetical protein L3Q67_02200 [Saccharothrix sp. AJ9571]|nr:hypothetical protein L3Q67_02200 [Saccharothrix sp. AJ9571]
MHRGFFSDGPDLILLNPEVAPSRWRQERLRAACRPAIILIGLIGVHLIAIGIGSATGFAAALLTGAGAVIVGASALSAWVSATFLITEHCHDPGVDCRLERARGAYFYRTADFRRPGHAGTETAHWLLTALDELHRTPVRAWLDPDLPDAVHRVVWEALSCLDRTRDARALTEELAADPAAGELTAAAREALSTIDRGIEGVLNHVHGCLVLTRSWESKLRHADLAARTNRTLAELPGTDVVGRLLDTAETLPQNVFAYITAANDVTNAGPFPWEMRSPAKSWVGRVRRHLRTNHTPARSS